MSDKLKYPLITALAMLVGAGGAHLLFNNPVGDVGEVSESAVETVAEDAYQDKAQKIVEISPVESHGGSAVPIVESEMPRPDVAEVISAEDIAEDDLSAEAKKILLELQEALDDNDIRKVRKAMSWLVSKIQKGEKVPVCMRTRAVEVLGWFGKDAAIDLITFVADSREEVASEAFTQFELALQDCEMGDTERSMIVKAALRALNDEEQIDSLLMQLNDMRNSRRGETILDVLENGSDQAKRMMLEQLPDYTDSEVTTEDGLKKWLAENPDDEVDAELYGPK